MYQEDAGFPTQKKKKNLKQRQTAQGSRTESIKIVVERKEETELYVLSGAGETIREDNETQVTIISRDKLGSISRKRKLEKSTN